jgi:DNA-binding transcriptional LysR family regulator
MQLNSIEGIKTAVSLGLGAAFVSSSAIEKEIELKTIEILKIENIRITRPCYQLLLIQNVIRLKHLNFSMRELCRLKENRRKVKR